MCSRMKHEAGTSQPYDYQLQILTSEINRECPLVYILPFVLYHSTDSASFFCFYFDAFGSRSYHVFESARLTISVLCSRCIFFSATCLHKKTFFSPFSINRRRHKLILIPSAAFNYSISRAHVNRIGGD